MSMTAALQLARQWAFWFQCAFFVVEIGPDLYSVTARVSHQDIVVEKVEAA